ncbi:excalibur calcium-binding domain-containing protein [Mycobacteroides chelonae]|uniref:excalibur calcium-binding domain-containing protein n=1 Tax=Mycobacteroides chelonae TaxID=1774 RepID=UPI00099486C9|nr:excalibur calcium-binding domain-containing protein [Mycobacteroides chelonae]
MNSVIFAGKAVLAACLLIPLAVGVLSTVPQSVSLGDPPYGSCKEAHSDGAYNIKKGEPGYSKKLDRDNDGIACEG